MFGYVIRNLNLNFFLPSGDVRSKCASRKRKSNACSKRKSKKRTAAKIKYAHSPGPMTNNAFLNYLRHVRRKYCGLSVGQLSKLASKQWRCMSDKEKERYRNQAYRVQDAERRQRNKIFNNSVMNWG
ncbi:protamine-like [Drosophila grimshawi]|uniref:protamine-like n=1 Tax=Drosophila grimshawi TaxID=7222 RepID=UPI0013EF38CD|nr:protamine-like [Drosophila grimshawi]